MYDVCDRGDPYYSSLGKAATEKEARELALKSYREAGYRDPQIFDCEFITPRDGKPFFDVELTYAAEG